MISTSPISPLEFWRHFERNQAWYNLLSNEIRFLRCVWFWSRCDLWDSFRDPENREIKKRAFFTIITPCPWERDPNLTVVQGLYERPDEMTRLFPCPMILRIYVLNLRVMGFRDGASTLHSLGNNQLPTLISPSLGWAGDTNLSWSIGIQARRCWTSVIGPLPVHAMR